jgi:hypothetical protein
MKIENNLTKLTSSRQNAGKTAFRVQIGLTIPLSFDNICLKHESADMLPHILTPGIRPRNDNL